MGKKARVLGCYFPVPHAQVYLAKFSERETQPRNVITGFFY